MHFRFPVLCALAGLLAAQLATAPADALTDILTRRSLYLSAGLKRLAFDAPEGACFLDENSRREAGTIAQLRGETPPGEQFLAAMGDCLELAGATPGAPDALPTVSINWNNPAVGDVTGLPRTGYLDRMERALKSNMGGKGALHRSQDILATAGIRETGFMAGDQKITSVYATTQIQGVPLVLRLTYVRDHKAVTPDEAFAFAEDFLTMAISLNEGIAKTP